MPKPSIDRSGGYEAAAAEFMTIRSGSSVGVKVVREWVRALPDDAAVLDLGCGHGLPISQALIDEGVQLYAIDVSPTLIAAFRRRFPHVPAECSAVEHSEFFGRRFDGVVAWGLAFLLDPEVQASLIRKVAGALNPGGRFLFTSPQRACEWMDTVTGQRSVSLGSDGYRAALRGAGLTLIGEADDEGENHYYFVCKPNDDRRAGKASG